MEREIGNIGNYYGGLSIKKVGDKYFWSIHDWDGDCWDEIPKYLYDSLNKYQDEE